MKKILLLLALAAITTQAQLPVYLDETKPVEQRVEDALSRMTLNEKIRVIHAQSKFSAAGVPRLGMPDFWTDDGPHGVRPDVLWDEWVQAGQTNDSCVAFPALTCLAASWNPAMARLYGESLGEEARYRGKDMILGPGVNMYRTPFGGRNFEYMGEDPLLASRMVVPYVQGLQSKGVASCVKHYALNNDEEYRHQVNVVVSDRALHEIYLPAFRAAVVEGKAWGIMGAYNLYRDQHNCHNDILLNRILKGDWQYDGVVVSDWGGCHDTHQAITNGLDMEFGTWTDGLTMGRTNAYDTYHLAEPYKQLIREGRYTERELNEKVRRVLRLYFRTTMSRQRAQGFLCSDAHYDAARQIAREGIVLLKNEGVKGVKGEKGVKGVKGSLDAGALLPLDLTGGKRLLVVGENAIKMMTVGGGSSSLKVQREVLPLDALQQLARSKWPESRVDYVRGYVGDTIQSFDGVTVGRKLYEPRSEDELIREAVSQARQADYVVFIGGLNKASRQDSEGQDRRQYELPYAQNRLVEALADVNPRLVFVNISGNAVAMSWISRVPAVVQGWFGGSEGANALAEVLFGDVNPSGKLPFTWTVALNDVPAHRLGTYPGTWRTTADASRHDGDVIDEHYAEGVFMGYRGVEKYGVRPLFAFGHGLSYTTFRLGKATASASTVALATAAAALPGSLVTTAKGTARVHYNDTPSPATSAPLLSVTVPVTNTGSRAGSEVVQLYIRDVKSSVERPAKELKAFQKVFLQPGETRDVTLAIGIDALSFYDEQASQWCAEAGQFEALVGTSSSQLPQRVRFTVE